VIVAVEGPSASGKTTWCARQRLPVVAEYAPTEGEPDGGDEAGQAAYWVEVNAGRWQQAQALEHGGRVVLCDSDPLKLHYSWCLARVGAAPWSRFGHELRQVRAAFAAGRLGLADLVLVSIPSSSALRRQRAGDRTRRRRTFDLHETLAGPLREWYAAVEAVGPGRVVWSFPATGVPSWPGVRPHRSDGALLERVLEGLPSGDA
jgi:nicotinamide riboside kinase